ADEGDDVVVGGLLDLGDPLGVDGGPGFDGRQRVGRNGTAGRLGPAHRQLDAEHLLEPGALGPDRAHLRERVTADHRATPAATGLSAPMSWRRWAPGQAIRSAAAS